MKTRIKKAGWKRVVIIGSAILLVAVCAVYVWASVQAWNTTSATTEQASANLKKSVDDTLATENVPESTQVALYEVVKSYNDALVEGPCELPVLYEWQSNLPWLKDTRQQCLDTAQSADELAKALISLQTFLTDEAASTTLIKQATGATATPTDYTSAASTWQKVADDKTLVTEDAFKPIGEKVIEVSKAIADAYTALAKANTAEDKAAFDAAKKALDEAYARLNEVKTVSSEVQASLVDTVVKAYENV